MDILPRTDDFTVTPQFVQRALSYGLGLGVLGSVLFLDILRPGLPMLIWLTAFAMATLSLAFRTRREKVKTISAWLLLAIAAATVLVIYLNPVTFVIMAATVLLAAAIVAMELRDIRLHEVSIYAFVVSCLRLPLQALTGGFVVLGKIDIKAGMDSTNNPTLFSILRGLIIALPLLLIFGALFSSADASFERAFNRSLQFFGPDMPERIFITFCMGWLATGLLTTIKSKSYDSATTHPLRFRLGEIEMTVVMGMLLAMFLLFVILQMPYLFGGHETIESTSGLTLADYARRGFFELVSVSVLTLAVLLLVGSTTKSNKRFRPFALGLIACLILIMASAGQRLILYLDSFGLTLARLSAGVFMIWLATCLAFYTACLLRQNERSLVPGAVYSAIVFAFALSLSSPPMIVTRYNIDHANENGTVLDVIYLNSLGSEVIPRLLQEYEQLNFAQQCQLAWQWASEFNLNRAEGAAREENRDWRNWNFAYEKARKHLLEHKQDFPLMVEISQPRPAFSPLTSMCRQ